MAFNWLHAVEEAPQVVEGARTAVEGIAGDIEKIAQEIGFILPAPLQSFLDELRGKAKDVGQAVAANTPAEAPAGQPAGG